MAIQTTSILPASSPPGHTKVLLVTGFSTCLVLLVLIAAISLSFMNGNLSRVNNIINVNIVKYRLLHHMHEAARERVVLLHTMLEITDAFEQDALFQEFNHQGAVFSDAREQLLALSLSEEERDMLAKQGKATGVAVPIQLEVVDNIQNNRIATARDLLLNKAEPLQATVLSMLQGIEMLQENEINASAKQTEQDLHSMWVQIGVVIAFGLATGIGIAVIMIRRITRIEIDLQREKRLAEITLHSIGDAVITTDIEGKVDYLNPVAESITGWALDKAKGLPLATVWNITMEGPVLKDTPDPYLALLHQGVMGTSVKVNLQGAGNKQYAIEFTAAPIRDEHGKTHGAIVVFRDVSEIHMLASQLSYQASHDALTGLVNRREFEVRLQNVLDSARSEYKTHVLCYLDLDQFKIINDTCGHAAGDELLIQVSNTLKNVVRNSDTLARLGGDEFGAILEGCSLEMAKVIAEKMREQVSSLRFSWANKQFEIGVSIGIVPITPTSGNLADLFSAADSACYEAKEQGRNRVHVFDANDVNIQRRQGEMHLVHRITEALEKGRFILYCQPIVAIAEPGQVHWYEILVRMEGEHGNLILPNAFIPAAERYNLMPQIDKYVIQQVGKAIQLLARQHRQFHFSVNVSGQSLSEESFMQFLLSILSQEGIDPRLLTLEITETATVANLTKATRFIHSLKQLGCKVALDDFGSGLSSFTYLKNIPVDILKIDGSFVRDIIEDATDRAFVKSINQIATIMGLKTVAEYVENQAIARELTQMGVNYLQGYHLGTPRPLDELLTAALPLAAGSGHAAD